MIDVDLRLYIGVLWRFKAVLIAGFGLAVVLAVLAYGRVGWDGGPTIVPRGTETWQARSTLLITQSGFPYGRAVPKYADAGTKTQAPPVQLGDQSRFSNLSQIYAQLANSDAVQQRLHVQVPVPGAVKAEASIDPNGLPLPLLTVSAVTHSADTARRLASGATEAFRGYVAQQQSGAGIAAGDRVELDVLDRGAKPTLIAPRKKTLPVLVFFALMIATFALVFVLENARPTMAATLWDDLTPFDVAEPAQATGPARRTA